MQIDKNGEKTTIKAMNYKNKLCNGEDREDFIVYIKDYNFLRKALKEFRKGNTKDLKKLFRINKEDYQVYFSKYAQKGKIINTDKFKDRYCPFINKN